MGPLVSARLTEQVHQATTIGAEECCSAICRCPAVATYLDDRRQCAVRLQAVLVSARAVSEQQGDARLAVPLVQQAVVEVVVRVDDAVKRCRHAADRAR